MGNNMVWVSVKDALPKKYDIVITARPAKNPSGWTIEQGVLKDNGYWKVFGTSTKAVTHWMPLPDPPEVG